MTFWKISFSTAPRSRGGLPRLGRLMVVVGVMSGCSAPQGYAPVHVGEAAPAFELIDAASQQSVSNESLEGEVVVLAFWSTSCANCIREMDELNNIHASARAKVIGIALDDDRERVLRLVEKKGVNYQILMGDQETFERFDGYSIPYTIVIDGNRKVRKKFYGKMTAAQFDGVYNAIQGSTQVAMRD